MIGAEPYGPAPFLTIMRKLLLLISVIVLVVDAAGQIPPKMVFRNRVVNLGTVTARSDTTLVFHYKNEGDSALVITGTYSTCPCIVPTFSREPLMPGDSSTLTVHYKFPEPTSFSNAVTITFRTLESTFVSYTRIGISGKTVAKE